MSRTHKHAHLLTSVDYIFGRRLGADFSTKQGRYYQENIDERQFVGRGEEKRVDRVKAEC